MTPARYRELPPEWYRVFVALPPPLLQIAQAVWTQIHREGTALHQLASECRIEDKPDVAGDTLSPDTNRQRAMRCDHRENFAHVLLKLLAHVDLVTADVCRAENKEFLGIKVATIAKDLQAVYDFGQRTVERCIRHLGTLCLMDSTKRAEAVGDRYKGHTSIRKLAMHNLAALVGLARQWSEAAAAAVKARAAIPLSLQVKALQLLRQQATARRGAKTAGQVLADIAAGKRPPRSRT